MVHAKVVCSIGYRLESTADRGNRWPSIGFIPIIDPAREERHYWGDAPPNFRAIDRWSGDEADLGKSYGTEMILPALARCFAGSAVSAMLVDPLAGNRRVHRLYARLGFRFVERRRFGKDDCFVYRLNRLDYAWPPHVETA